MSCFPSRAPYNLSNINIFTQAGQDFINLTEKAKSGHLSKNERITLANSLNPLRSNRGVIDRIFDFLSRICSCTRTLYLNSRVTKYVNYLNTVQGKKAYGELEKTIFIQTGMQRALGIHLIPADLSERLNIDQKFKDKRTFATSCIDFTKGPQILKQLHLPIVKAAVSELALNYERLDSIYNVDEMNRLKEKIKVQHKNLESLTEILSELQNYPVMGLTLLDETLKKELSPFIKGDFLLVDAEKRQLKISLENKLKALGGPEVLTSQDLRERRSSSTLSTKGLTMQADLFKQSRNAALWAANQHHGELKELNISANKVYKIPNEKGETAAFYKEGSGGEQATGIMEEFMWQLSLILGLESQFTPTKQANLRTKRNYWGGEAGERQKLINEKGEFVQFLALGKARHGGIQIANQGKMLGELSSEKLKQIPQSEIINGMLTILTFGMYDAHHQNIIVDKDNKLHFFDNTRSMPHSNDVIFWGGFLLPSFRSGLLNLDGCYKNFTAQERELIKNQVEFMGAKMKDVKSFIETPLVKKQLASLPKGWFNSEEALKQLSLRLQRMRIAMMNPNIRNLQDLIFEVNRELKFFAALDLYKKYRTFPFSKTYEELEKMAMVNLGHVDLQELLKSMQAGGIDVEEVQKWCHNPNLSLRAIFDLMRKMSIGGDKIEKSAKEIEKQYLIMAKADFKDINRNKITETAYSMISSTFASLEIPIYKTSRYTAKEMRSIIDKMKKNSFIVQIQTNLDNENEITLLYKKKKKVFNYLLDYTSKSGYVKLKFTTDTDNEKFNLQSKEPIFYTLENLINLIKNDSKPKQQVSKVSNLFGTKSTKMKA